MVHKQILQQLHRYHSAGLCIREGVMVVHEVIAVPPPIRRYTLFEAVNPLGEKIEIKILPLAYHLQHSFLTSQSVCGQPFGRDVCPSL